jgi:hypothetical protein
VFGKDKLVFSRLSTESDVNSSEMKFLFIFLLITVAKTAEVELPGKFLKISWNVNGSEILNLQPLEDVFLQPEVRNRKLYVIVVHGNALTGKSYLLNHCVQLMYNKTGEVSPINQSEVA